METSQKTDERILRDTREKLTNVYFWVHEEAFPEVVTPQILSIYGNSVRRILEKN